MNTDFKRLHFAILAALNLKAACLMFTLESSWYTDLPWSAGLDGIAYIDMPRKQFHSNQFLDITLTWAKLRMARPSVLSVITTIYFVVDCNVAVSAGLH